MADSEPNDFSDADSWGLVGGVRDVLALLSSLRLTVALFAASMVLVLAGTLAQIDHDIWYVIDNYFRTAIAWIDVQVFFPRDWDLHFEFPFPGGWLIGAALGINLLAAHAVRFKVTGRGNKLWMGLALLAAGAVIVWAVVQSGLDDTVESELSSQFCNNLWHGLRAGLGGVALALAYALALTYGKAKQSASRWAWWLGLVVAAGLLSLTGWLMMNPDARLDPSGLRILWQLIKATGASLVLWAGCWLTFGRRAGVVLLHGGIALMMFSELITGLNAVETHMSLFQGVPKSYAEDTRTVELVVTDKSDPKVDRVVVIPRSRVLNAVENKAAIEDPALPLAIRIHEYLPNVAVRLKQPGETNDATAGSGLVYNAIAKPSATGVDTEQETDYPAAYVELLGAKGESSGKLLLSPQLGSDGVKINGKSFEVSLQFRRYDRPYTLTLLDFIHEKFVGTETAKSFKSRVRLQDEEAGQDREVSIWMNNPLRYRGDTLYQSGFDPQNPNYTVLQVVTNRGWMIPYVACMIVATGMLTHFGGLLFRFVRRREEEAARRAFVSDDTGAKTSFYGRFTSPTYWVPAAITILFAGWIAGRARVPKTPPTKMQVNEFGKLPVAYGGRIQPIDALARNLLRQISDSEVMRLNEYKDSWLARTFEIEKKVSATQWLLDTVSRAPGWKDYRAFRIHNLDVLQILDLKPRSGFRYSFADVLQNAEEFDRQVALAREAAESAAAAGRGLELTQQKLLELKQKINRVLILIDAFDQAEIDWRSKESALGSLHATRQRLDFLTEAAAPRPTPPATPEEKWRTALDADFRQVVSQATGDKQQSTNAAISQMQKILAARSRGDAATFNAALADYQDLVNERASAEAAYEAQLDKSSGQLGRKPAERLSPERVEFEAYFNHFSPFVLCNALYISAFVLAALALLGWSDGFNRSANWLLWLTFALHTYALFCRIYISGRPPVTNLYSSAVFIGWAAVLFALVFEGIYKMGLGNLLAAFIGFPTMLIARDLAADGDTFAVMQAVLDTQFWLATHVVCITFGYATTFLAGAFGIAYLLLGRLTGKLDDDQRRQITRMTYGTVCFSIFFSFVGTVLGGLWADDSWGRFWGWDPKENGALLIVIWNAIVLHARWGRMIGERGLATLVVFGNIVVAWSWFGVNQLGVGLHAYGATEGRTFWLIVFVVSQLAVMATACLPDESRRESDAAAA